MFHCCPLAVFFYRDHSCRSGFGISERVRMDGKIEPIHRLFFRNQKFFVTIQRFFSGWIVLGGWAETSQLHRSGAPVTPLWACGATPCGGSCPRILSCRDPRGGTMPRGRPQASWLRYVESCLRDTGLAGLTSAWTTARRRPKDYRCKVDAATRCSGVCPHT